MCFESCRAGRELLTELKNNSDPLTLACTKFLAKYKKEGHFPCVVLAQSVSVAKQTLRA